MPEVELQKTESGAIIMDAPANTPAPQPPVAPTAGEPTPPPAAPQSGQPEPPQPPVDTPSTGFKKVEKPEPVAAPEWFDKAKESLGVESYDELVNRLQKKNEPAPAAQNTEPELSDDYIKNALAYYKEHGTLKPYLEAFNVKYEDMTPEELVRRELRRDYQSLSDAAFERLYQEQVVEKYKLDESKFDEDTVNYGKELLKRDSEKYRAKFLEEQKQFIPPAKEDVQGKMQEAQKKWTDYVMAAEPVKRIMEQKAISIDVDGDSYTYEVEDPNEIVNMAIDNNKFWSLFADRDGNVNMDAFMEVAAFAKNREQYRDSLIGLGKTLGVKDIKRELKNGEMPRNGVQRPSGSTDWRDGFLEAAQHQLKK